MSEIRPISSKGHVAELVRDTMKALERAELELGQAHANVRRLLGFKQVSDASPRMEGARVSEVAQFLQVAGQLTVTGFESVSTAQGHLLNAARRLVISVEELKPAPELSRIVGPDA